MCNRIAVLLALGTLVWTSIATAGAYRWVDDNGVTHYSQTPPPDRPVTRIAAPPPPPARQVQKERDRLDLQLQDAEIRKEKKQEQEQEQQKAADVEAARTRNCEAARRNLEILEGSPRRMIRMPSGEYRRLTAEEREEETLKAQARIDEFCDE
ncbi:MAG TPA: DUF4124 domain-containing protein [Sedimenticola thiotaurini]|uniref:DUF4124 domain-containing protein n=1 Tax=Sedimenticola thiotaurini TaxID=1543721 RepID=A0A831RM88_9GAMM|nr:DUF4124 domain-containing protein [Sedimenticola thiotaurini]